MWVGREGAVSASRLGEGEDISAERDDVFGVPSWASFLDAVALDEEKRKKRKT